MLNSSPQIQARQILDIVYPIGIIVEFASNVNPNDIMHGQTWELYGEGKTTVCKNSGTFATLGSSVGAETHTLTTAQIPAHTHTRGTMNITGSMYPIATARTDLSGIDFSGAFSLGASESGPGGTSSAKRVGLNMNAANGWTGETSSVGSGQAHNNIQPSIVVLRYCRIA